MKPATIEFFGLDRAPFLPPRTRDDLYISDAHRAIIAAMYPRITAGHMTAIVGPSGAGKTMIAEEIVSTSHVHLHTVRPCVSPDRMTISHIYHAILDDITGSPVYGSLERRARAVRDELRNGRKSVLVLDDAHALPTETIRGLHALHEICGAYTRPLAIILVCQPALIRRMENEPLLSDIHGRLDVIDAPMVAIRPYLARKIDRAGGDIDNIFTRDGLHHVCLPGTGIPLEIERTVAEMMDSAADVRERVSASVVRHVEQRRAA